MLFRSVPIDHYTLKAQINIGDKAPFFASWIKPIGEGRAEFDPSGKLIINHAMVSGVAQKCQGKMTTISVADKTAKKELPPLLFSLVDLQKMAAKMGYSPEDVLKAAQAGVPFMVGPPPLHVDPMEKMTPRTDCPICRLARRVLQIRLSCSARKQKLPNGSPPSRCWRPWRKFTFL